MMLRGVITMLLVSYIMAQEDGQAVPANPDDPAPANDNPEATGAQTESGCPEGYISGGNSCYMVQTANVNWQKASDLCKENGAELASILSEDENKGVVAALDAAGVDFAWVGLNDMEMEAGTSKTGTWKWANGKAYGYNNWLGMPADVVTVQDCVLVDKITEMWTNLAICSGIFPFVCRKDNPTAPDDGGPPDEAPPGDGNPFEVPPGIDVEPPSVTEEGEKSKCFHSLGKVRTPQGIKYMKDIKIGDEVLTQKEDGNIIYDKVYSLAHASADKYAKFVRISVDISGEINNLHVTEEHVLPTTSGNKPSNEISTDDMIYVYNDASGKIVKAQVVGVEMETLQGLYNPLTLEGTVLVDDVLATVYAHDIGPINEQVAHALLWPLRAVHRLAGSIENRIYSKSGVPYHLHTMEFLYSLLSAHS